MTINNLSKHERAALLAVKTVKSRYGNDNPYYWGAFVFLGEAE